MATNNKPFLAIFLLFLGFLRFDLFSGQEAQAPTGSLTSPPGIYVFGDSLVDTGNNNHLLFSIARANYPHNGVDFPYEKPTGRYCNGKNSADAIAEKLGLPLPPPYLSLRSLLTREMIIPAPLTGVNFASGAAGIFNSTFQSLCQAITFSDQVNDWITIKEELDDELGPSPAQMHISKSIFGVTIGVNDLSDYISSSKETTPQQYTQSMADTLKVQLKRIYDTGARKFLVTGVPLIGCTPRSREKNTTVYACNEEDNMLASLFNKALVKMLQQLKEETKNSMAYTYFDSYKAVHDILSNPAPYGFTDVTSACCGFGKLNAEVPCLPFSELCPDRTKYFFWDLFGHPTEAAAKATADMTDDSQYSSPLTLSQLVSS
ncbi:unnamed protein product [Microthlaspi erraticum]|uniref:Uncharacterized protein n=1 Tax=Microthlaspi erraticum TaxID=1685480 RepID=A0A6D2IL40_9BRAS|nr:unnamed protein product [Microthlaspi erraticum]